MKRFLAPVSFIGVFTFIISVLLVFDLFIHKGAPASFDEPTHITNIAQTYSALTSFEFPPRWGGGFARYGLPAPQIAQQTTAIAGALLTFITRDVIVSYNLLVFFGAWLSAYLAYRFLRLHVAHESALAGMLLFHFAPYRIMNIYIRGALPEFLASMGILAILLSLHMLFKVYMYRGALFLTLSIAFLLLTHPFMLVVGSFLFIPYTLYLAKDEQKERLVKGAMYVMCAGILGIGLSAYYILPLFLEIKYFYYGSSNNHFVQGHFLSLSNFLTEQWYYFYKGDIYPRGHVHMGGIIEAIIAILGIGYAVYDFIQKRKFTLLHGTLLTGIVIILFTQSFTEILYTKIPLLGNIQHPWRMLTAYIFIPPFILALLLNRMKKSTIFLIILIFFIAFFRFPQLYGKNYVNVAQKDYFLTDYNLHGIVMDTIWMGDERTYPYKKQKPAIIEGKGDIDIISVKNGSRRYKTNSESPIRLVDYTFYFPGWAVYVDGAKVPIEFQDPYHRGLITYLVPSGNHTIELIYKETKVRLLGDIITLGSLGIFIVLCAREIKIKNRKHA